MDVKLLDYQEIVINDDDEALDESRTELLCNLCDFSCQQLVELSRHAEECHLDVKLYQCSLCSLLCSKIAELRRHMKSFHEECLKGKKNSKANNSRICPICMFECGRSGNMVRHMRTHTGEKPFSCMECSYKCTTLGSLHRHFKVHTGEKPFFCTECNYRCSLSDTLKEHMRKHTGEKPFVCQTCGYKCTRAGNLDRHMRKHTGERPYSCIHCGYKCSQAGNLKEHIKTHTEEKPFFCTECKYRCSRAANLDRHMKIHPGKALKCSKCSFNSLSSVDFQKHFKTHFQKHKFVCSDCSFTCFDPDEFEKHLNIETEEELGDANMQCSGARKLSCTKCDFICSDMSELGDHLSEHPDDFFPNIQDEIEAVIASTKDCPVKYVRNRGKRKPITPTIVSEMIINEDEHVSQSHSRESSPEINLPLNEPEHAIGNKLFVCVNCGLVCASSVELQDHLKEHLEPATPDTCLDTSFSKTIVEKLDNNSGALINLCVHLNNDV